MRIQIGLWPAMGLMAGVCLPAYAAPVVSVVPVSGHPRQAVTVAGSGFGASEAIDVYLDTVDTLLVVSTTAGGFSASVTLPAAAQPGLHYATAIGRHSGVAGQVGVSVSTPWVEQGYGHAHVGWNPYENTLGADNVGSLGLVWSAATIPEFGSPVVAGGRVYTAGQTGLSSLSAATGATVWRAVTTEQFYAMPAVVNGIVYDMSGSTQNLYAVNAATGAMKWTTALGNTSQSSPVVVNNVVYVGCSDSKLYAVNAATGAIIWSYKTGNVLVASPAVSDGVVYVGSSDNILYALDAGTGALLWSFTTPSLIVGSASISNGMVFVGSYAGMLYAISAGPGGGREVWATATKDAIIGSPAVTNSRVVIASKDGTVYALNARTGAADWTVSTGQTTVGNATIANGMVALGNNAGGVLLMDLVSGAILQNLTVPGVVYGAPVVSDGVIYLNSEAGRTFAFSVYAGSGAARPAGRPGRAALRPDRGLVAVQSR